MPKRSPKRTSKRSTSHLSGLNPGQSEAVRTLSGPLLVLAGAGTGKTRVVTVRIAELIRQGTQPSRILAVTFTNKAAREMQQRVGQILGKSAEDRPQISTFHSLCVRILRRHAKCMGYPDQFAICDRGDQESFARQVLREIRAPSDLIRPNDLLAMISQWKNSGRRPADAIAAARSDREHIGATAFRKYQASVKASGAMDFDDLLLVTEEIFREHESIRAEEAARFDHVLVDEYQDTNSSQYAIIKALTRDHRNLCVVGDDDQSIYGWRGAEVRHILGFHHDWPDATVVRLEENYRCTGEIIAMANCLIAFNRDRHDKVLRAARAGGERPQIMQFPNETKEAAGIVQDIKRRSELPGRSPGDFAVLFRTNEQPRHFENELRKAKIPYVLIGGMSFFDRKEVRDVLSYLKWIDRPEDEVSLLRIINTPPRGLGTKKVSELMSSAVTKGVSLWHLLSDLPSDIKLARAATSGIEELSRLIHDGTQRLKQSSLTETLRWVLSTTHYESELGRCYPDENEREARWASVEQVVNALAEYERDQSAPTLTGFLDSLALGEREVDDEKQKQLERDAVTLMTLHSAKGLEFPEVYLVGLEEGILPHHRSLADETEKAIDEERRLCYVGVTRAEERLTLSMSLTRMKWGKPRDSDASRFLFELTGQAEKAPMRQKQRAVANQSRKPGSRTKSNRNSSRATK